jgi:hypothetical protein
MEIVNGFTIVARSFDQNGHPVILAAKDSISHESGFEYVTAWHWPGNKEWWAGHYFSSFDNATSDYRQRVTL